MQSLNVVTKCKEVKLSEKGQTKLIKKKNNIFKGLQKKKNYHKKGEKLL